MIVSKLSLEGRMKGDGAVLKLYLKVSRSSSVLPCVRLDHL